MQSIEEKCRAIGGWLLSEHFTFYSADTSDGKMIVTRFQKLNGYDFEIDFTVSEASTEVHAFLQIHAEEKYRRELVRLIERSRHQDVAVSVDPDGNFSVSQLLDEQDDFSLNDTVHAFWDVFSFARERADAVYAILGENADAAEAEQIARDHAAHAGWELDVPYTLSDYPDRF